MALVDRIVNSLAAAADIPADDLADVGYAWLPNPEFAEAKSAASAARVHAATPRGMAFAATPAPAVTPAFMPDATPAAAAAALASAGKLSARRVPVLSPLLVR